MITLGLTHIGHAAGALSAAVQHPERAKAAAPFVLTLLGFSPIQVELLITGFVLTFQAAYLALSRAGNHLPSPVRIRQK